MPITDLTLTMGFLKRLFMLVANVASMNLDGNSVPLLAGVLVAAVSLGYVSLKFERSSLHYATLLWQVVVFVWAIVNLAYYVTPEEMLRWHLSVFDMFLRCLLTWTWIFFTYAYTRRNKKLSWMNLAVAAVPYTALWLAYRSGMSPVRMAYSEHDHSIFYLSGYGFCYFTIIVCMIILISYGIRKGGINKKQVFFVACALLPPLILDAVATLQLFGLDRTIGPIGYSYSGILLWVAIGKYKLLDIVPLALREVFDNMKTGVILLDSSKVVVEANPAAKAVLGSLAPIIPDARLEEITNAIEGSAKSVKGLREAAAVIDDCCTDRHSAEAELLGEEGLRTLKMAFDPITQSDGRIIGCIVMIEDVSEERALMDNIAKVNLQLMSSREELVKQYERLRDAQAQLIQSEKMASLGLLVAGVAHEINTPLGTINSNIDTRELVTSRIKSLLVVDGTPSEDDVKMAKYLKTLDDIGRVDKIASTRILDIVKSLRNFSRLDEAEFQVANIHEGLDSTLILIHNMLKNRIEVVKEYGDIPSIRCYPNQLNQVFLNLLVNAAQAIEGPGTVTIGTERAGDDAVVVRISDDGKGIAEEDMDRIFSPGFTTKGVGVGTGLGLSICYKIVESHQGRLSVSSVVGKGTEFSVWLPVNGVQGKVEEHVG